MRVQRVLRLTVPLALAALEFSHPAWSAGAVSQAILAARDWWLPLHLLLILGYSVLVWLMWLPATLPRVALVAFLLCNTAFLAVDGLGVGLLAAADPGAADRLWSSPVVTALANLAGATWSASLLALAAMTTPAARTRPVLIGLGLTWLTFVASAPPLAMPSTIGRVVAAATGGWLVYVTGKSAVPVALLIFAAVLRQHVGAEAALGMLFIAIVQRPASLGSHPK